MIRVRKTINKKVMETSILDQQKDRYLTRGWKVVKDIEEKPINEDAAIILKSINHEQAAGQRERSKTSKVQEANAIALTEIKPKRTRQFNDGLLKG